ncbi:proprotein convertase P-domain-containing protein [Leptolyngbya ohadii]|uniref:proprotein convertase P-domain-containing protein n=1 Tax=Leptolyngbya ohadii TaxID=1962290 RepID=UPI000B59F245|nr:proprotein convertase P-domain-containing protein [Leptolyngbya ohadii]
MAGSPHSPLWMFPLPAAYPTDREGQILLRGGAKIPLHKCPDRFTVRLARPVENLAQWAKSLGGELEQTLPAIGQILLRVDPAALNSVMTRARRSAEVVFASHAYELAASESNHSEPASTASSLYLTDEITLQFQPQTTAQQMEAMIRAAGLEVLKLVPGIPKAFVYRLTDRAIVNPLKLANRLIHHPNLLLAEPNVAVAVPDSGLANWTESDSLGLPLSPTRLNSPRLDRSIGVAVVDRAIDLSHPAFGGMGKIVAPLDLTASSLADALSPDDSADSRQSSGTLCAQIAIGEASPEDPSVGSGIAPGCSLMPITVDLVLDDRAIEQVFDWGMNQGAAVFCWQMAGLAGALPPSLRQRVAVYRAGTQGRWGKGCVVLVDGSGWSGLPEVISVGDPTSAQPEAIAIGIQTGIAARILCVNPDLTAVQVEEILRTVQAQQGQVRSGNDILQAVDRALTMAVALMEIGYASDAQTDRSTPSSSLEPLEFTDSTPHEIPDFDEQGILCPIAVAASGTLQEVEIRLAIDHGFMGDLKIWLIPPQGDEILLQDRTLGSLPSFSTTYSQKNAPYLRSLVGRSAQGNWQLKICDLAPGHRGYLKEWRLRLGLQQPHQMS